jgi:hypothetical protein
LRTRSISDSLTDPRTSALSCCQADWNTCSVQLPSCSRCMLRNGPGSSSSRHWWKQGALRTAMHV